MHAYPAGKRAQAGVPGAGLYRPARHALQPWAPREGGPLGFLLVDVDPAGQAVQFTLPSSSLNVPGGHVNGAWVAFTNAWPMST